MSSDEINSKHAPDPIVYNKQDRVLIVVSAVAIIFFISQILMFRYGRDQGIFVMVSDAILHGGMPYRDAWDFKPPGIYFFFTLARFLFGSHQIGIRVVECAGLITSSFWMVKLAEHWWNDRRVGYVAAAMALMVHAQLDFWHTAQPESFGGMLTIGALWLWARSENRPLEGRYVAAFVAGIMFGFAGLLKPPLIAGSAVFSAAFLHRSWESQPEASRAQRLLPAVKPIAIVWAGTSVPLILCGLWFLAGGALRDLWEVLFLFTPHYTALGWQGRPALDMLYQAALNVFAMYSSTLAVGMVLFLAVPSKRSYRGIFMVLGLIAFHVVGIALQAKFFAYHYGATFPLVALLAAIGYVKLWNRLSVRTWWMSGLYFAAFCTVTSIASATVDSRLTFFKRTANRIGLAFAEFRDADSVDSLASVVDVNAAANRTVAQYVKDNTPASCSMFVWGFEPVIYDLAQRRPASRYLYNLGQRIPHTRRALRALMMRELEQSKPCAIVVEHSDVFPLVSGTNIDSASELPNFIELSQFINNDYSAARKIEDFDVYLRH